MFALDAPRILFRASGFPRRRMHLGAEKEECRAILGIAAGRSNPPGGSKGLTHGGSLRLRPRRLACEAWSIRVRGRGGPPQSGYCLLASVMSCATFESAPTGSTKTMLLAFRYMRSGPCSSLPRFTSMFLFCLVVGSVWVTM